jgi:hypothetical protein
VQLRVLVPWWPSFEFSDPNKTAGILYPKSVREELSAACYQLPAAQ